ncbi:exonuclease SbcCD subunit D [Naasia aerilata]|uniref:Nuclease SbcCD subunit D n=1 Tax=Naasia aerilata TaxID=1162966 RepID=A0ABM8GFQ9_9MICO|nr:exonuclease SbcCD subunit D [Naasia aerilata]BDZ47176.1 nuclease SbcCD subunit D [Naasia aerilata]
MKILHTSDWHIGRTFHTHSTLGHLRIVLDALAGAVREQGIDVVLVAGDVFDSSMPSAEAMTLLSDAFRTIREAGARIVMTSGNHDSITRLGFHAEWIRLADIHVLTQHSRLEEPVTLEDEQGPVHFYGIPYLEPSLIRHDYPGVELRTHEQALAFAMQRINEDRAMRAGRSVVLSHCFTADVAPSDGVERDISSGGLDLVPASVFDGPDYVALGHIHGRAQLSERVRYSGAPLHYSFSETDKLRGGWLVELGADRLGEVAWLDLPVPRRLTPLTGELDDLLTDARYAEHEGDWVKAILTDRVRPMDAMRRLQQRFTHCVALEFKPSVTAELTTASYGERVRERTDGEIVAGFLEFVRNGVGPSEYERGLVNELFVEQDVREVRA